MRVFLGGTCGNSTWREDLIALLNPNIDCFNPIVPVWNKEAYTRELVARAESDYCLYVITPEIVGYYSIAEVVDDSNKRPKRTLFCAYDPQQRFNPTQAKSFRAIEKMLLDNGARCFKDLEQLADFLNQQSKAAN